MVASDFCRPSRHLSLFVRCLATFLLLAASPRLLSSAAEALPPLVAAGRDVPLGVSEASGEIAVDGRVEEAAWGSALSIPLRWETEPGDNVAAPVETECLVTHDLEHLYVAFRALDPSPERIRARLADRDSAFSDDFVGIILDTFNDERRAFQFFVNPRGVQMDVFLDQVNGNEDPSWDAIWDSAGRLTDTGYEVEMAIPFSSLRFPRTDGAKVWGLDALRFWPRSSRHRLTNVPRDRDNNCHLCQLSKIAGFEGVTPGRNLELAPTLTASRTDERGDGPGADLVAGDERTEGGVTVRWGVTPNLILNGAVNPDFSQVEADSAKLSVNERFALFFPERRPFFLEGADFFDTLYRTVFTRNVADPDWGVKFTGKEGGGAYGAFITQDSRTNLLLPGSQGSSTAELAMESTDVALRYRRDFGASSAIGALFTSRSGGGYENQVFGLDGLIRFSDSGRVRFQALGSSSRFPNALAKELDQPEGSFGGHAIGVHYNHDSTRWLVYATYDDFHQDFRADLGFLPQVDYRKGVVGLKRVWRGGEGDWFNRISFGGDWDLTQDQGGQELEQEAELFFNYDGPNRSSVFVGSAVRRRFFNGVTFEEVTGSAFIGIQPTGRSEVSIFLRATDDIDFANTRAGTLLRARPRLRYDLGQRLRLNLSHDFRRLKVEGGTLFEANLSELRAVYQFSLRTFFRVVGQWVDVRRNVELYDDPVDAVDKRLSTQLLASYKLNPQTVVFLGYSDTSLGNGSLDLARNDRTFFFKVGYAWVM